MPHIYPPEDPRSAASTFAPHQPGAGVVADDVEDGELKAAEANEKFADEPLPDTGPGPDRSNYVHPRELEGDDLRKAAGLGDPPRGEGRKGEATRERDAKRREEAEKADKSKPLSEAMERPGEASTAKSSSSKSKSSDK